MTQHLLVTVRLHQPRFHGTPEWPPAPGRLFQALVAGAAQGSQLPEAAQRALAWLEALPPPSIWAPQERLGTRVDLFVPNNDLDAKGGDPANIGAIRTNKAVQPHLLEGLAEFGYAWTLNDNSTYANDVLLLAEDLYQFGRGVDLAWAVGQIFHGDLEELFEAGEGRIFRPSPSCVSRIQLPCPARGTLESLIERYRGNSQRLRQEGSGKTARVLFTQPPKARFAQIAYNALSHRVVYDLCQSTQESKLFPWPLEGAGKLVQILRDSANERLLAAFPTKADLVEGTLIGRRPGDSSGTPPADRIRILPLGSIGSEYADRAIRRVVIEVPPNCPMSSTDIHWAFSGLGPASAETGEIPFFLTEASESSMLNHFMPEGGARTWRSVTAVALPVSAGRRRIDPDKRRVGAKDATERLAEEGRAIAAVHTALRHATVRGRVLTVRVQREPFEGKGTHAEAFAQGTRFNKHQLWHVEVRFGERVNGPIVIGDGRFLGLGVMAPVPKTEGIWAFRVVSGLTLEAHPEQLARALRRAVISRAQAEAGVRSRLPPLISGHTEDGRPLRDQDHLAFQFDPESQTLLVLAPHKLAHRSAYRSEREELGLLKRCLESLSELRAGASGLLKVERVTLTEGSHPLLAAGPAWSSVTPYLVTRHAKASDAAAAIVADVRVECERRGLPKPTSVEVSGARGVPGKGLSGAVQLKFAVAVRGPLLLGKSRLLGGGMFEVRASTSGEV